MPGAGCRVGGLSSGARIGVDAVSGVRRPEDEAGSVRRSLLWTCRCPTTPFWLTQPDVGTLIENGTPARVIECRPIASSPAGGRRSAGVGDGLGSGVGEGEGDGETAGRPRPHRSTGSRLMPTTATTTTAAAAIASLAIGVHVGEPPRRPPGAALWGRVQQGEHVVEDAVRGLVLVRAQPRPDDARDVPIGAHRATSRTGGRESASSAARSARIA